MRLQFICILILCGFCQNEKPRFRVLAPQFICPSANKNQTRALPIPPSSATTIRLQTMSGQRFSYNWSIRFKVMNPPRGQRFNLIVWKAARNLEKKLSDMSPSIAEANLISINNTSLIEGVEYTFNISAKNDECLYSNMEHFKVEYADSKKGTEVDFGRGVEKSMFSVIMLGSEVAYADMPYILEAEVTPCNPTEDYYFIWRVVEIKRNISINMEPTLGKILYLKPKTFRGGEYYDVQCMIRQISDNSLITTSYLMISTLRKGMKIILNIQEMILAINTPLSVFATVLDPDNNFGNVFLQWTCKQTTNGLDCQGFQSSNSTDIIFESGFPADGRYEIQVSAQKQNIKATSKCTVIVRSGILPMIEFEKSLIEGVAGKTVEVSAKVSDLIPGCNLKWEPLSPKDFNLIDSPEQLKTLNNEIKINSLDETFLSELVDYTNETITRSFPLIIPAKSGTWQGLEGNKKYVFRLLARCTCPADMQCETVNTTSYSDVTILTNEPPKLKELKVTPSSGVALLTQFTISTKAAEDLAMDYPITYTFSFKIPNRETVTIGTYLEVLSLKTILPFSDLAISVILKACDSRGACAENSEGVLVTTTKPNSLTEESVNLYIEKFTKNLYRKEYSSAFYLAYVVMETLKSSDYTIKFQSAIENIIVVDINKQIEEVKKKTFVESSNMFIQEATKFIQVFQLSDNLLQEIVRLRDTIFEAASANSQNARFTERRVLRKKRSVSGSDLKNFIDVSEYIISTSNIKEQIYEEKRKLISKLQSSERDLCDSASASKESIIIDSNIVSIGIEKLISRPKTTSLFIPYSSRIGTKLNSSNLAEANFNIEDQKKQSLCFVKYALSPNMLESQNVLLKNSLIYYISLYTSSGMEKFITKEVENINLKIPVVRNKNEKPRCIKWILNNWDESFCTTSDKILVINKLTYIICQCIGTGYFSVYYQQVVETTTEIKINPETTTTTTTAKEEVFITSTTPPQEEKPLCKSNNTEDCKDGSKLMKNSLEKSNKTVIASISIFILGVTIFTILIFLYKKKMLRKRSSPINMISAERNMYAKLHDDHLLEGSKQSLDGIDIFADDLF